MVASISPGAAQPPAPPPDRAPAPAASADHGSGDERAARQDRSSDGAASSRDTAARSTRRDGPADGAPGGAPGNVPDGAVLAQFQALLQGQPAAPAAEPAPPSPVPAGPLTGLPRPAWTLGLGDGAAAGPLPPPIALPDGAPVLPPAPAGTEAPAGNETLDRLAAGWSAGDTTASTDAGAGADGRGTSPEPAPLPGHAAPRKVAAEHPRAPDEPRVERRDDASPSSDTPLPSPMQLFQPRAEPVPAARDPSPVAPQAQDVATQLALHIERLAVSHADDGSRRVRLGVDASVLPDTDIEIGESGGELQVLFFCHTSDVRRSLEPQAATLAGWMAERLQRPVWVSIGGAQRDEAGRVQAHAQPGMVSGGAA